MSRINVSCNLQKKYMTNSRCQYIQLINDEPDELINESLKDFDEYTDRIEAQYSSGSCVSKIIVAENK